MYPVSNAFLQAVQEKTRRYHWTGRITTKSGAVIEFGAEDIVKGSGYISSQCCGNTEIELGTVYKKSIGDLGMQLDFLWEELQGYKEVLNTLKMAKSVREASDAVLTGYEKPADQSEKVKVKRAEYGQGFYDKYAGGGEKPSGGMTNADCPFLVRVDASDLNIRVGAGTDTAKTGKYTGKGVFTIVEVRDGKGSSAGWGRLKSGAGWVALSYCKRV